MSSGRATGALALGVALLATLGSPAAAQDRAVETETMEITAEVLDRLADVYPVVIAIAEDARPRIEQAETEPVARAIEELAQDRIEAVLKEADFTPAQYLAVVRLLNANEELRSAFQQRLDARWADGSG